jgi:hypothetical protein
MGQGKNFFGPRNGVDLCQGTGGFDQDSLEQSRLEREVDRPSLEGFDDSRWVAHDGTECSASLGWSGSCDERH